MYFADLTRHDEVFQPTANVLNVGWLCNEHPFPEGDSPPKFLQALRRLVSHPVKETCGFHICDLCPPPSEFLGADGTLRFESAPGSFGNGEIRVPGLGGVVYAAPVLIAHYVEVHHYLPPAEFVEAVMACGDGKGT